MRLDMERGYAHVERWYPGMSMAYLAKGIAQTSDLVKRFDRLAHGVIPGVEKWNYTFENGWSGPD
jgi:hypothetical protein